MGRCRIGLGFLLAFLSAATPAEAYVQTLTKSGVQVRWSGGFKFNLAGNPQNSSGLSDHEVFESVVHSLERWKMASGGEVQFDYWQGRDSSIYEPNSDYNGLSSVYFASNADGPTGLTPNILGLTQVWYNTDSGQILEADTVLNDQNFIFTENPTDTSGFGSESDSIGPSSRRSGHNRVFVENVLTHEFGHSLGFSHSGSLQSTMLYMESPEQAHLGCDEQTGIHAIYPSGDASARTRITGSVVGPDGAPIFGANVEAISRRRGAVLGAAMTDPSGNYSIGGLEAGTYYIMAEPYFAGPQPLPAYYAKISSAVCPQDDSFGRTFLVDGSGFKALAIEADAGATASVPPIKVGCDSGKAAITGPASARSQSSAPMVFDGLQDAGFGTTDRFKSGETHYYKLSNVSGHLEIRALSYSLYSPIQLELTLVDSSGEVVPARSLSPIYQGDSGYVNFDSALIADDLPDGDYYLEVTSSQLNADLYPAGQISLDSAPFALITGTMNQTAPELSDTLPFNARCRMGENFTPYQSPPGLPPRAQTQSQDDQGGCSILQLSTLAGSSSGRGGGSGGPGSAGAVGWLVPWLMMAFVALRPWRLGRLARRLGHG